MKNLLTALIITLGLGTMANAQSVAPFKNGDRIAFLGNSITDGGHYHSYIWLYYMTHFPNTRITCFNAGVGGDNVKQMGERFNYEVLSKKPNIMTFTWGMNDTGYIEWLKPDAANYAKWAVDSAEARYMVVEAKLKQHPEIKKIFILGSPYDATTKSSKNGFFPGKAEAFTKLIDFQQQAAERNGWPYVDFYHPMLAINKREQEKDSLYSTAPNGRVHPDNDGHLVMASLFLKAQGLANKPVADFSVNAKSKTIAKAVNCSITNVAGTTDNISFDYLAYSLPYPIDTIPHGPFQFKKQSEALKVIPFMDEFNKEELTVKGLKEGKYKLTMDGQEIGQWSSKELADGLNLATQTYTPEYQQAIAIREMNEERWDIERRLRQYAWLEFNILKPKGLLYADNKAAMDVVNDNSKNPFVGGNRDAYTHGQYKAVREAWQKEQDALINEIYASNKPQVHKVILQIVN